MSPGERFASLRRTLAPATRQALYSPALLARSGDAAEAYLVDRYEAGDGDELGRMQFTDVTTYLPDDLLVKADRMTMAHSLEGRSPLLDHELLELCARIPATFKVGAGGSKIIFRLAMRDLFPAGFLDRPKMGFSVPLAQWLRGHCLAQSRSALTGRRLVEPGWFDPKAVGRMLDEHAAGRKDWSALIWNMLALGEWANAYLP